MEEDSVKANSSEIRWPRSTFVLKPVRTLGRIDGGEAIDLDLE